MATITSPRPEQVLIEKIDNSRSIFTLKPLEKGYGITIGNALRRILLSSMEGYAITSVRAPGVLHEYETIAGVRESMQDLSKNLQEIRFKKVGGNVESKNKIVIPVKKKKVLRAGDITQATSAFEISNPELVICYMDESAKFELEITVEHGRDYRNAHDKQPANPVKGLIPINAIFTPIRNVKYTVEKTRVGQETDYDSLLLEIQTDGTTHPEEALERAASILIEHYNFLADRNKFVAVTAPEEFNVGDKHRLQMHSLLETPLEDLKLSTRAYNCLKKAEIKTLRDLVQLPISTMRKFRNFGPKSLQELQALVASKGLDFGMDISAYDVAAKSN